MPESLNAAWVGLMGVAIGFLSANLNQWLQWRRERAERKRTRELDLKKELYLPIVSAFTEASALISTIPQTPHDHLGSLKLSPAAQSALAAKDLIANKDVIRTVGATAKQFALGFSRLMVRKMEEVTLATDLQYISSSIDPLNAANAEINRHVESLLAQGGIDCTHISIYNERFRVNQARLAELFPQQDEKQKRRNEILQTLLKEAIKELIELMAVSAQAVVAIRDDLDLPDEREAILAHYRDNLAEMGKLMPEFVDKVWETITKAIEEDRKKR
jgi:hypothetical protein